MMSTLYLTKILISLACLLQSVELILLYKFWKKDAVWDWDVLKIGRSKFSQLTLSAFLKPSNYLSLLILNICVALLGIFTLNYYVVPILLLTTTLSSIRWGGTFNGGSDYMTLLVLLMSSGALLIPKWSHYFWFYLGIQVILSYFISGFFKLKNKDWRNGESLKKLLQGSNYNIPSNIKILANNRPVILFLSWLVILFELSSIAVFINLTVCLAYIAIAFIFHVVNFYILGLNRFVFAWLAAYPALYFLISYIHQIN